jgi:hypothetical protein
MSKIYCGNNSQYTGLIDGSHTIGTRYACLKKGFGIGYHMPYDKNFTEDYDPIDTRKIWCGSSNETPDGYNSVGNLPQCLQKGIGAGKRVRSKKGKSYTFLIPIFLFLLISGVLFAYLYFYKPNIVTTKGDDNIDKIDWNKFVSFYIPMVISIAFVILILYKIKLFYSFVN